MSRSKDAFAPGGRAEWIDIARTRERSCPICGGDSWCAVTRDGTAVACRRNSGGIERTDVNGATWWLHRLGQSEERVIEAGPDLGAGVERAPVDVLDRAHRMLLADLRLTDEHRAGLRARGLSDADITARGYRTLPLEGRGALARRLVDMLGEASARGIPGVYVRSEGARTWWTLGGSPGLLVPVRDARERIVALKVRRDDAGDGPRYTYVSSARHGGSGALQAVHVPMLSDAVACDVVRVTEGELKADVATVLSGVPTISIPGVGSWRAAATVLRELGAIEAVIAFDADHATKPEVAEALGALVADLAGSFAVAIEYWPESRGKGIDDVLTTHGRIDVLRGRAAVTYAEQIARRGAAMRRARSEAA